jgi:uncharacterized membrane protein
MDNLKRLEEKRVGLYQQYAKENKVGMIFLVIAVLSGLPGFFLTQIFLIIIGIIFFVVAIIFFGRAQRHSMTFKAIVKAEIVTEILKEQFDDVSYEPKNHISIPRIVQTGMVKRPDRYVGEDLIMGSYKGVKFEVSDIDLKERVETRDSKGNVTVSYQTYFKGRWYVYTHERQFKEELKIIEGRGFGVNTKGLVKLDVESIEFNKKFAIFATSQEFGFYLITSSMIEKLMELEKLHRGSILYYYVGNELHIGVNDRRDYMELSIKTPINEASLKTFMSDIDLIPAIINELRLDSSKFKNTL